MAETRQTKKMIGIVTGLRDEPDYINLSPEDETKTIADLVLELAEQLETSEEDGAARAAQLRGLIGAGVYSRGSQINPETVIGDLNFTAEMINGENVRLTNVTLQEQHSGGI